MHWLFISSFQQRKIHAELQGKLVGSCCRISRDKDVWTVWKEAVLPPIGMKWEEICIAVVSMFHNCTPLPFLNMDSLLTECEEYLEMPKAVFLCFFFSLGSLRILKTVQATVWTCTNLGRICNSFTPWGKAFIP